MNTVQRSRAVSPAVAVILMVAITVILSATVGAVVLDLNSRSTSDQSSDLAVQTTTTEGQLDFTVVSGSADKITILSNGTEYTSISNVNPGDSIQLNIPPGAKTTIISSNDGSQSVVTSHTPQTTATPPYTIDSFDDGELSEYATNDVVASTDRRTDGTHSLKFTSNGYATSYEQDGLDAYPQPGDTVEYDVYVDADSETQFWFGFANTPDGFDGYRLDVQAWSSNNHFAVYRFDDGNPTFVATKNPSIPQNEWLHVTLVWGTTGSMDVTLEDQSGTTIATLSGTDDTYQTGGLRIQKYSGTTSNIVYFDNVTVTDR